jgi:putative oxidoreductase
MASSASLFPSPRLDAGLAVLRVVVGIVFLAHGAQKLFGMGFGTVIAMFAEMGIPVPGVTGPLVSIVEFFGGLALIGGLFTRVAAAALAMDMLCVILLVRIKGGFFSPSGVEFELTLCAASLTLAFTGPGAVSLDAVLRRMRGWSQPPGSMSG